MATYVVASPLGGLSNLAARCRIAIALALRQMKIKSGEDRFGYVLEIFEPVLIISLMSVMMEFRGTGAPPVGDSYPLFIATGYLPFKAFMFISNDMRKAIGRDSEILGMPGINQMDGLFAGLILKSLTTLVIMAIVVLLMNACGYVVIPDDPLDILCAFFWIVVFSLGFGLVANALIELVPGYSLIHKIISFKLLLISGVFFLPEMMPPDIRYYLAFNPLLHLIAWYRSAFLMGFHSSVLDIGYLIWWSVILVCLGFLLMRVFRSRLSEVE